MTSLTEKDLKPFQTRAAGEIAEMIQAYPGPIGSKFGPLFNPEKGTIQPFLCRLRAITGAGKTPTLAVVTKQLGPCIILWTTNRSAVISQTHANLDSDGKYAALLPDDAKVYRLGQMTPQDWMEVFSATQGVSILYSTVAAYNQDPATDKLKIHQSGYWERLGKKGDDGRQRPLFVFYDEGHGATKNQFARLLELSPSAFVLASASPLPEDLTELIGGRTPEQREQSLADRTVTIPTPEVVKAGLLKTRLFLSDCNVADSDALGEANTKWKELAAKFAQIGDEMPIAGFLVNSTLRGIEVWEELVKWGVPKERIAVHLNEAEAVMLHRTGTTNGLIDTYKTKKQPEQLKDEGYTHLIWNLTLNEGWDEPMAYVAYIDGKGRSINEMTQRIGRFVRQPNAAPFADPDLNAAYFYFNVSDSDFEALLSQMQREMTVEGTEIIALRGREKAKPSRDVPVKETRTLPGISYKFADDAERMADILLKAVPLWDDEEKRAKGFIDRRVFATDELTEEKEKRERLERTNNASTLVHPFLMARLQSIDQRIEPSRFPGTLSDHKRMKQRIQFGSEAMRSLSDSVPGLRDRLQDEFRLAALSKHSAYVVPNFKMTAPNLATGTEAAREKYQVRCYENALHSEYNGFNPFEVAVAEALDGLSLAWCRNPSRTGFGIPIPYLGAEVENFYPDFLLWTPDRIWAIDPKGDHLKEGATQTKLFDVANIPKITPPVHIALILEGKHTYSANNGRWTSDKKATGYTLVRRTYEVKTQEFDTLPVLMQALLLSE